ncbi:hypothetical protein HGRIS_001003 [Hohenbuehelia grisea]|uniref:Protein phosphatase methylesterase 1 n=1 Tax=Hohenbuehelia grisea TaxID=104357 RepID=A0ABR3IQF4_9AGAR
MSDLYRSALSARLAKLPLDLSGLEGDDDDDEESEVADSIGALPGSGMGPPAMPARNPRTKAPRPPNPDFAPISASPFFDSASQVDVPSRSLDVRAYYTPPKFAGGTVMVCHHGAGYSGLSFACFAKEVADMSRGECGVLAFDARRHGKTTSTQNDENLSVEVLADDLVALLRVLFPDPKAAPTLLLVGHSMGGAVCARACPLLINDKYRIAGLTVLDVVEGSAMDALPHMHSLLNTRPDGFDNVEAAVEWHVKTNTIRNPYSARISVPSIVTPSQSASAIVPAYQWRTPLRSTAEYWPSWFKGLSSMFLSAKTARLLVLAGTDRLDKELMIGQMQGKFQLVVVPGVGHMIQEDDPTKLAEILVEFWRRNERVVVGIKRVGDD